MKEFFLIVVLIIVAAFVLVPALGNNVSLDEAAQTIREATQRAQAEYATQQAQAEGTAAVIAAQANGTAQAEYQAQAEATRQAEATAAGLSMVATAGMMTAQADQATSTAVMSNNYATATAVMQLTQDTIYNNAMATAQFAQAQAIENQAAQSTLELERTRMTNRLLAYLPYSLLVVAVIVGVWIYHRERRVRFITRDANGDAPIVYDVTRGGLFDPDRTPGPYTPTQTPRGDALPLPAPSPADVRAAVERDQMTDLARAFARMAGQPGAVLDWLKNYQAPRENAWQLLTHNPASLVEIVEPDDPRYETLRPILQDVTHQMEQP